MVHNKYYRRDFLPRCFAYVFEYVFGRSLRVEFGNGECFFETLRQKTNTRTIKQFSFLSRCLNITSKRTSHNWKQQTFQNDRSYSTAKTPPTSLYYQPARTKTTRRAISRLRWVDHQLEEMSIREQGFWIASGCFKNNVNKETKLGTSGEDWNQMVAIVFLPPVM